MPAAWNPNQWVPSVNMGDSPAGGLSDFSQWTQASWEEWIHNQWQSKTEGIGDPIEVLRQLANAIASALTGDFDPFIDLLGEVPILGDMIDMIKNFDVGNFLGGLIPVGLLTQGTPNRLANGGFHGLVSLEAVDGWSWDDTIGLTSPGSATVTADGTRHVLLSESLSVEAGQAVDVSGGVKWSGLTGTGTAFELSVREFTGETVTGTTVVDSMTATGSGGFTALSGSRTVGAGVDSVRVMIVVTENATAGQVWWDDLDLHNAATSLPQQWITGLESALGDLGDWITTLMEQLGDLISGLLANPGALLGDLAQGKITGLTSALSGKAAQSALDAVEDFMQDLVDAIVSALRGVPVVGKVLADIVSDLGGLKTDVTDAGTTAVAAQTTAAATSGVAVATGLVAGQTFSRSIITANGTWTKPTPAAGKRIVKHGLIAINGGGGGGKGQGGTEIPARGGSDGGYAYTEVLDADMPSSVSVTVGAGAAGSTSSANSTTGGVTSIGSLLSGQDGTSSIRTIQGALSSTCRPGSGGDGGTVQPSADSVYVYAPPTPGQGSALATGGAPGSSRGSAGGAGSAPTSDPLIVCGASGGGGGAAAQVSIGSSPGSGGAAAAPGGGGGASGGKVNTGGTIPNGAAGGNGAAAIITFFEDIP